MRKFRIIITVLFVSLGICDSVYAAEEIAPLSTLSDPYVTLDEVDQQQMYTIQNRDDVVLFPNDLSKVEYTLNNFQLVSDDIVYDGSVPYSGSDEVKFYNAGYVYQGGALKHVDFNLQINDVEIIDPSQAGYLRICVSGPDTEQLEYSFRNVSADLTLSFNVSADYGYENSGALIKDTGTELIWEDFDVSSIVQFPIDQISQLFVPVASSHGTTIYDPSYYYFLDNLVNNPDITAKYYSLPDGGTTERYKDERLGYEKNGNWLSVIDRWNSPVRIAGMEPNLEQLLTDDRFKNLKVVAESYGGTPMYQVQNTPGQNIMSIFDLKDGYVNVKIGDGSHQFGYVASNNYQYFASPFVSDTSISKALVSESGSIDGVIESDELVEYSITVSNNSDKYGAYYVPVRDSLLEALPPYITASQVEVSDDVEYIGDLTAGNLIIAELLPGQSVELTYSLSFGEIPNDITEIANLATDNGKLEKPCPIEDCSEVVVPVAPKVTIDKQIVDESIEVNNVAQPGETITYMLTVSNPTLVPLEGATISDTMWEQVSNDWSFNNDVVVTPPAAVVANDKQLQINVGPASSVEITYSIVVSENPAIDLLANIATVNEQIPDECEETDKHCSQVEIPLVVPVVSEEPSEIISQKPVEVISEKPKEVISEKPKEIISQKPVGNTIISKAVTDQNGDNLAESGEWLTYTITVENNSPNPVENVLIRDSQLEAEIDYKDLQVSGDYHGKLVEGDFYLDHLDPGDKITISYQTEATAGKGAIINKASDDGSDPKLCKVDTEDCGITKIERELKERPILATTGGKIGVLELLLSAILALAVVIKYRIGRD